MTRAKRNQQRDYVYYETFFCRISLKVNLSGLIYMKARMQSVFRDTLILNMTSSVATVDG